MTMFKGYVLAASMLFAAAVEATTLPRLDGPVTIDGDLSDPLWSQALHLDRFYDIMPGENSEPPVATAVWTGYDAKFLYVAFRASDPAPRQIRAPWVPRDRVLADQDFVQVNIDSHDAGISSAVFRVNPRGIQTDGTRTESQGRDDFAPDFEFESAARITATGWEAEMRIPLSSIRYPRSDPQRWRLLFYRVYPRGHRYQIRSAPMPRGSDCWLCEATRVEGITGLPAGGAIAVTPYLSSRTSAGGPAGRQQSNDGGLDVKWQPRPGATIDLTFRPDFSQVESDVAQLAVNERFALFYPEKRPFFMEGADLLASPIPAIHTRTITSPLWGARLTGRPGNHAFTLVAADDRGGGSVIVPGPSFSSLTPQPHALALLGRYRYRFGRSSGGLLLTSRTGEGRSNQVAGPDLLWWAGMRDRLTAQVLFSRSDQQGDRRDGHAAHLTWDRTAPRYGWSVSLSDIGSGFRADSGFVPQTGVRTLAARTYALVIPGKWFSRLVPELVFDHVSEPRGPLVTRRLYPRLGFEGWHATVGEIELHANESTRGADGKVQELDYATAMVRFLPSRRFPYLRLHARYGDELDSSSSRRGRGTVRFDAASGPAATRRRRHQTPARGGRPDPFRCTGAEYPHDLELQSEVVPAAFWRLAARRVGHLAGSDSPPAGRIFHQHTALRLSPELADQPLRRIRRRAPDRCRGRPREPGETGLRKTLLCHSKGRTLMKTTLLALLLLLLPAATTAAGSRTASELHAIIEALTGAIAPGDKAVFDRWLADDFILVDRDGSIKRKKEIVEGTSPLPTGFTLKIRIGQSEVRDFGNVAVSVNEVIEDMEVFGQPLHVVYRDTHVFHKRNGEWKLVVWQYVELPKDGAPVPVDPARYDELVGEYAWGERRFVVTRRGDKLFGARAGKPESELVPESETVFYVPGSEFRKIFVRDRGGKITGILDRRKGSDVLWTRIPAAKP